MEFKSKTALAEHIKELVDAGYLEEEWHIHSRFDSHQKAIKFYKVNFNAVKKNEDKVQ
jgi:hypothetical protein